MSTCIKLTQDFGLARRGGRREMPAILDGETYYRTSEACRMAGISRSTLLRWVNDGIVGDALYRDRRGWRLFTTYEIVTLKTEALRIRRVG